MVAKADIVIIGAGVNGLTAAALLARAGRSVIVVEAGAIAGGAAASVEFAEGFSAPLAAHVMPAPDRELVKSLNLADHGWARSPSLAGVALSPSAPPIRLDSVGNDERFAAADREGWQRMNAELDAQASILRRLLRAPPVPLAVTSRKDARALLGAAFAVARSGPRRGREFLRIISLAVADYVAEFVVDPSLAGALATDALWGLTRGPRAPGTLLSLLHRRALAAAGWIQPAGGPAAFAGALAAAATSSGTDIRYHSRVARIGVDGGKVDGVMLANGEVLRAPIVVSALDPVTTLLELVGPRSLETGLVRAMRNVRGRGGASRVLLGIRGGGLLPESLPAGGFRVITGRSVAELELAADALKYARGSAPLTLEITQPTRTGAGAAPDDHEVLSITAQYTPFVAEPAMRAAERERILADVTATLAIYIPDIADRIVARACFTPADLAARTGSAGGHWHHADIELDQFFLTRPAAPVARYQTPIDGLYLAGAGTHPGGGVTGWSGRLAAAAVLAR